ncbi:MAG: hypothetical protein K6E50_01325 [Lachnospiraceae bacterium]|nr:hypothetical protein [Lachnospiraceae bacterium]
MSLLLGLIGANVIAHTIGNKIVENTEAKARAQVQAAEIQRRKEIKAEKIRTAAEIKKAKIEAKNRVETVRLGTAASVMNTAMMTGAYPGYNQAQQGYSGPYGQMGYNGGIPESIPQNGNVAGYIEGEYREVSAAPEICFCERCGKRRSPGAAFCGYCGNRYE